VRQESVSDSFCRSNSVDTTRQRALKFVHAFDLAVSERRHHGRFGCTVDLGSVLEYCPQPGLVRQMEEAGVVASKSDTGRNVLRLLSRSSRMGERY